ncbi:hypothetical protein PtA15_17A229 [Puccinia triticina]|uniref:Uncharacterized protein n=1 Tax=Puccinia triticina TaxID=208348 RepID=A0ABY7D8Y9_9BASI|nr:uncharacterized protein PtA15_17A229 [Puccinia triticina]WAQ92747.1 hypothetical protein PtA15_17A229 [Puccinia triticina]
MASTPCQSDGPDLKSCNRRLKSSHEELWPPKTPWLAPHRPDAPRAPSNSRTHKNTDPLHPSPIRYDSNMKLFDHATSIVASAHIAITILMLSVHVALPAIYAGPNTPPIPCSQVGWGC